MLLLISLPFVHQTFGQQKADTIHQNADEPTKLKSIKFESVEINIQKSSDSVNENEIVYRIVEEMPEFPGGMESFFKLIARNIKYPVMAKEHGIEGTVYIQVVIDKNGKLRSPEILRGPGAGLDEEALRVVSLSPDWKPGKQKGQPVNVYYNIPIKFSLDNSYPSSRKKNFLYDTFDQIPEFPGGVAEMNKFIKNELKVPAVSNDQKKEGIIYVQVVVTNSGKLKQIQVVEGLNFKYDKEAVRVVAKMPKWKPGIKNGEPVDAFYNIPIEFK